MTSSAVALVIGQCNKLTVPILKEELAKRDLSTKGLKAELIARLEASLEKEQEKSEKKDQTEDPATPPDFDGEEEQAETEAAVERAVGEKRKENSSDDAAAKRARTDESAKLDRTRPEPVSTEARRPPPAPLSPRALLQQRAGLTPRQENRNVPPSQNDLTATLRIDNFVRPFTDKDVKELLGQFGKVTYFWMPRIKTHCFVTFETDEQAVSARDGLYDLQWPERSPKRLIAEYISHEDALAQSNEAAAAATPPPAAIAPRHPLPSAAPQLLPLAPRRGPDPEKLATMFKLTKTKPPIFYCPLTEEELEQKHAAAAARTAAGDKAATEKQDAKEGKKDDKKEKGEVKEDGKSDAKKKSETVKEDKDSKKSEATAMET